MLTHNLIFIGYLSKFIKPIDSSHQFITIDKLTPLVLLNNFIQTEDDTFLGVN